MSRAPRSRAIEPRIESAKGFNVEGFGFDPSESEHHFRVTIPTKKDERIYISEHFSEEDTTERLELNIALGAEDAKVRVILARLKWDGIAEATQLEFNQRLRQMNIKPSKWKTGGTPISRLFGKELVLLAWAIEDADPALTPVAVRNWLGLAPEERWWLFTMTNAATGHAITGRNKGWRKAVRFALTENPVSEHRPRRAFEGLFEDLDDSDFLSGGSEPPPSMHNRRKGD
jgi:Protein of unknown function (DUF3780)